VGEQPGRVVWSLTDYKIRRCAIRCRVVLRGSELTERIADDTSNDASNERADHEEHDFPHNFSHMMTNDTLCVNWKRFFWQKSREPVQSQPCVGVAEEAGQQVLARSTWVVHGLVVM